MYPFFVLGMVDFSVNIQKMEAKSTKSNNILAEMIKQQMKYYILHSINLKIMF